MKIIMNGMLSRCKVADFPSLTSEWERIAKVWYLKDIYLFNFKFRHAALQSRRAGSKACTAFIRQGSVVVLQSMVISTLSMPFPVSYETVWQ